MASVHAANVAKTTDVVGRAAPADTELDHVATLQERELHMVFRTQTPSWRSISKAVERDQADYHESLARGSSDVGLLPALLALAILLILVGSLCIYIEGTDEGRMCTTRKPLAREASRLASPPRSMPSSSPYQTDVLMKTPPSATGKAPAICPALVLPHCEARFAVPWEKISSGVQGFDMFGVSGKHLLRTEVQGAPGGPRQFGFSMVPAKSPILGSCSTVGGGPTRVLAARGTPYGELRRGRRAGQFGLIRHASGEEIVSMRFEPFPTNHLVLTDPDGGILGLASRCLDSDFFAGVDHLEVRVTPGADAILILCCVFGVVCLEDVEMPMGASVTSAALPSNVPAPV